MSGLILLAVLGLWGFICFWVVRFLLGKVKNPIVKNSIAIVLCGIFFLLPVADEIVGGFQFRSLCKEKARMVVDHEKIKGKTVISTGAKNTFISDSILPIRVQSWAYKDVDTNEVLLSWNDLHASGGWLSHFLNFIEGNPPYTFNGSCLAEGGLDYVYNNNDFKVEIRK